MEAGKAAGCDETRLVMFKGVGHFGRVVCVLSKLGNLGFELVWSSPYTRRETEENELSTVISIFLTSLKKSMSSALKGYRCPVWLRSRSFQQVSNFQTFSKFSRNLLSMPMISTLVLSTLVQHTGPQENFRVLLKNGFDNCVLLAVKSLNSLSDVCIRVDRRSYHNRPPWVHKGVCSVTISLDCLY